MVPENQFCTLLLLVHLHVIKFIIQLKSYFLKQMNKALLSHTTFYLEDDDHKVVDFNGETISFTCQLIKI